MPPPGLGVSEHRGAPAGRRGAAATALPPFWGPRQQNMLSAAFCLLSIGQQALQAVTVEVHTFQPIY